MGLGLFRKQARGGKGLIAMKFKRADDRLLSLTPDGQDDDEELLLITQKGTIVRQRLEAIPTQSRATTGVKLQKLDEDDLVASVQVVPAADEADEEEEGGGEEGGGEEGSETAQAEEV